MTLRSFEDDAKLIYDPPPIPFYHRPRSLAEWCIERATGRIESDDLAFLHELALGRDEAVLPPETTARLMSIQRILKWRWV